MKKLLLTFILLSNQIVSLNAQTDTLFIQNWENGHAIYLLPAGKFQKPSVWTSSDSIYYPPVPFFRNFKFDLKETYIPLTVYKGELVYYDLS